MSITYNMYRDQMKGERDGQKLPTWEELLEKSPVEANAFQFIDNEILAKKTLSLNEISKIEISVNKLRLIADVI